MTMARHFYTGKDIGGTLWRGIHGPTTKNLDLDRMATQAMFVHALEQA